jgi:hypothetical protein
MENTVFMVRKLVVGTCLWHPWARLLNSLVSVYLSIKMGMVTPGSLPHTLLEGLNKSVYGKMSY